MRADEGIAILLILILLAGLILLVVFYLKNLQDTLKEVSPHNRQVPPSNVWLMFIPLFNIIYPFILYPQVCDSVRREMEERGIGEAGDYGRGIGITMPILSLTGIIPILGSLAAIANLVLFIIFWSKMANYKEKLRNSRPAGKTLSGSTEILD